MSAINVLIDGKIISPDEICNKVLEHPEVNCCHKVRTRGKENQIMIDLHIEIDQDRTIKEGHDIVHHVERMLIEEFEGVSEVIIHLEPVTKSLDKTK